MTIAFNLSQLANFVNTSGKLDASAGLVNAAPVANGGTGSASLAANNVLLGNGTGALQVVAPSSSGNVLTSNGTTWSSTSPTSPGAAGQVFTGSGTFTVPAGVVKLKVQICGGGGGGSGNSVNGTAGGNTTFGSYLTANGGAGGTTGGSSVSAGGTASGGQINLTGGTGQFNAAGGFNGGGGAGSGTATPNAPGVGILGGTGGYLDSNISSAYLAATGYGNGGGGTNQAGGGGGYCLGYITGLTPGSSITVTIGAAGTCSTAGLSLSGSNGTQGICIIEW